MLVSILLVFTTQISFAKVSEQGCRAILLKDPTNVACLAEVQQANMVIESNETPKQSAGSNTSNKYDSKCFVFNQESNKWRETIETFGTEMECAQAAITACTKKVSTVPYEYIYYDRRINVVNDYPLRTRGEVVCNDEACCSGLDSATYSQANIAEQCKKENRNSNQIVLNCSSSIRCSKSSQEQCKANSCTGYTADFSYYAKSLFITKNFWGSGFSVNEFSCPKEKLPAPAPSPTAPPPTATKRSPKRAL